MIGKFEMEIEKLYLERTTMKELRKRIKWVPDSTELLVACKIVDKDDRHTLDGVRLLWKPKPEKPKAPVIQDTKT